MDTPLLIRPIELLIANTRYPLTIIGSVVFLPMILLFVLTGVIYPDLLPSWVSGPLELTGMYLTFASVPSFLLMAFTAWVRQNNLTYGSISALVDDPEHRLQLRYRRAYLWPVGLLFGLFMALEVSIGWSGLNFDPAKPFFAISVCIVIGQLVMWSVIGLVMFFSLNESIELNRLGKVVNIDLYNLDSLNGFGRASLIGLLLVAGGLALTALQSIDQTFRWVNYQNALIVGIPAIFFLVPLPIWPVHRRIRKQKQLLAEKIDEHIRQASRSLDEDSLHKLNALMLRKEQIHKLRNWPMDLSIFFRLVLYIFIPPLAWTGAALVEMIVDSFVAG